MLRSFHTGKYDHHLLLVQFLIIDRFIRHVSWFVSPSLLHLNHMCETADSTTGCGSYSDFPSTWGAEPTDTDEDVLLFFGVFLDRAFIILFSLMVAFKFSEEIRYWLRGYLMGRRYPYEKVADYLRESKSLELSCSETL